MDMNEGMRVQASILRNLVRRKIDRFVLYPRLRWLVLAALFGTFMARVVSLQGFFAAAYLLGFFYLQNLILFVTPNDIPTIQEEDQDGDSFEIPEGVNFERGQDASKPVIRKLGEFSLWKKLVLGTFVAYLSTYFKVLDLPVFWPLLLFYFIFIVFSVVLKQYQHMNKYGYSLSDFFKRKEEKR